MGVEDKKHILNTNGNPYRTKSASAKKPIAFLRNSKRQTSSSKENVSKTTKVLMLATR